MDPAVVAAHPMPQTQQSLVRPPSTQTPDSSALQQPGFGASSAFGEQTSTFGDQSALNTDLSSANLGASVDQAIYSQANQTSQVSQDYTSSGFTQSGLSHSLQTDNMFPGGVAPADSAILGKGSNDSGTISHKQYDIPPQLPMPPGHDQSNTQVLPHLAITLPVLKARLC